MEAVMWRWEGRIVVGGGFLIVGRMVVGGAVPERFSGLHVHTTSALPPPPVGPDPGFEPWMRQKLKTHMFRKICITPTTPRFPPFPLRFWVFRRTLLVDFRRPRSPPSQLARLPPQEGGDMGSTLPQSGSPTPPSD